VTAGEVLGLLLGSPPTLGRCRLACVDGPAGAGKTTFADRLATAARRSGRTVSLVHLDDVYAGWSGLPGVGERLRRLVVEPLSRGQPGAFPRWDWHRDGWADEVAVPPADLVVLEGVGSAHPGFADRVGVLVWVDAPERLRLERGLSRDGAGVLPYWQTWTDEERRLHEREDTRARADVLVDGRTGTVTVVRPVVRPGQRLPSSSPDG